MRTQFSKLAFVAMLYASLLSSCTSDLEMPPPPEDTISSSAQVWSYCVYPDIQGCYPGSYSACPGIGGELRNDCPYSNSNSVQSSSGGNTADNSSSSQAGQGNSSGGTAQEYNYCVFAVERNCLTGPLTLCPPGGELSNTCPYGSSSSSINTVGNSSSSTQQNSSSSLTLPSSTGSVVKSSSSQAVGQTKGNVFTDTRDGKEYKFEFAPDGKIWMSENLNYSRDNTLGYCYGVDINGANPHRDSTSCGSGYGRIYEWNVAMDGKSPQGLCPNGWHIPSTTEWSTILSTSTGLKMSSNFYIYPGNYNVNTGCISVGSGTCTTYPVGWKERDSSGFYWTSSGNSYFTGFWDGRPCKSGTSCIVEAETGASATDRFSVRCMADEDIKFNCGTNTYSPYTNFCADNLVYTKCGGKEYNPETKSCCDGKEYDLAIRECVDGTLHLKTTADYLITCNGGISDRDCNNMNVTLKVGECVEIEVMGYTNQYYLPTVAMRCQTIGTQQNASVTLLLNGISKTYSGSFAVEPTVELGSLKLGDNEFGKLCVYNLSGATSVKCNGPSAK